MTLNQRRIFYIVIFFVGIILMIFQIEIFRNTIINLFIPISIIIGVTIFSFIIDFENYKNTFNYSGRGKYIYPLINYLVGFGFIICSIFMMINYYFPNHQKKMVSYEIIEKTWLPGRLNSKDKVPVFTINFNGTRKELVFYSTFYNDMDLFRFVEFETRRGFFGFDIIENKKLKI